MGPPSPDDLAHMRAALALAHLKSDDDSEGLGANGAEFAV